MSWPTGRSPVGPNNTPGLFGMSSANPETIVPAAFNPATGALLVDTSISGLTITNDGTFATPAKQDTGNTSLASIDSKTPALGQALAAGSTPVVLTAAQLITLTPLSSVSVSNFPATQPISGTVAVTQSTSPWVISGAVTSTPSGTQTVSGSVSVSNFPASQAVTGTFFQTTQPVSLSTVPQAALPSAEFNGQTTGTTAGTAVQLPSNSLTVGIIVQALSTNTTSIFIGTSSVSSSNGFELQPGQATSVGVNNSSVVWIVSTTNGDKACWIGS